MLALCDRLEASLAHGLRRLLDAILNAALTPETQEKEAAATSLPVPAVIEGLIEVEDREGIVSERVNGPAMARYLEDHPDN